MISFDVLDRQRSVHRNAFLEASAGTGKTFAIENILVRLLIESDAVQVPLSLDRILVVTFTRASTRDLKGRVRRNLQAMLDLLDVVLQGDEVESKLPDYLTACIEQGEPAVRAAKRRIEQALFAFDRAQIFTIHGFCWRMLKNYALEAGVSLAAVSPEQHAYPKAKLLRVVRDFLRTELTAAAYTPCQLSIVLKKARSIEKLQSDIFSLVSKGIEIAPLPTATQLFQRFQLVMGELKRTYRFESQKIINDFLIHAPAYRDLANIRKQIHPGALASVTNFAQLFDRDVWDWGDFNFLIDEGVFLVDVLSPEKQKKNVAIAADKLCYPQLLPLLREELAPIIRQARDGEAILARMASDCQKLMWNYQAQEEMIGHNDLLQQMLVAIASPAFAGKVRGGFDAVIIDEFQDTDPVQWQIFHALFGSAVARWKGFLYLVGDPKQSIYAFRQADIYTYLSAAEALGQDTWATLDTNFRSRPPLVHALNTLFAAAVHLFPLPKHAGSLAYRPVKAGKPDSADVGLLGASLQFWLPQLPAERKKSYPLQQLERRYFFPAIAEEITRLHREAAISLRQCAVLVADRYQADRLMQYFKQSNIPTLSQRGINLKDSLAVHVMRDVLQGILNYQHASSLKMALGSKLIGMAHADIASFDLSAQHGAIAGLCNQLRHILIHQGAAVFFPLLLQSVWQADGKSVLEKLLAQSDGLAFYQEWQDISDLLIEEQAASKLSTEELIAFIDDLEAFSVDEEERLKATVDHEQEGVSILTSHVSKGLEFDIVFALGLIKQPKRPDRLIPLEKGTSRQLVLVDSEDHAAYKRHCEELDAEKMRQLYVALTRAKLCVYLPVAVQPAQALHYGEASPMDLLTARLGMINEPADSYYDTLYARILDGDGKSLRDFVASCGADISIRDLPANENVPVFSAAELPQVLQPPGDVTIPGGPLFVQSFTSLSQATGTSQELFNTVEVAVPHDFACALPKSPHQLPAGSETGTLLHRILEMMPFSQLKQWRTATEMRPWMRPYLVGTPFMEWEETIALMVFEAFNTPLPGIYGGFCLADVDPKKIYRETEFFYACEAVAAEQRLLFDASGLQPGFLKGVIDLFFEHGGKYYLLDWKSNWLGETLESYVEQGLSGAMTQHKYHLQAGIYAEAMRRYLQLFDRRPFEMLFGGAYYLFLRGISPNSGIYHFMPGKG